MSEPDLYWFELIDGENIIVPLVVDFTISLVRDGYVRSKKQNQSFLQ